MAQEFGFTELKIVKNCMGEQDSLVLGVSKSV